MWCKAVLHIMVQWDIHELFSKKTFIYQVSTVVVYEICLGFSSMWEIHKYPNWICVNKFDVNWCNGLYAYLTYVLIYQRLMYEVQKVTQQNVVRWSRDKCQEYNYIKYKINEYSRSISEQLSQINKISRGNIVFNQNYSAKE